MDTGSSYGLAEASHLSSPASLAFSQAAASAFRLQPRPFHPQVRPKRIIVIKTKLN